MGISAHLIGRELAILKSLASATEIQNKPYHLRHFWITVSWLVATVHSSVSKREQRDFILSENLNPKRFALAPLSGKSSLAQLITLFKVGKIQSLLGDVMRIEATWAESCSSNFCFHFVRDSRYFRVTVDVNGNQKEKIHNFGFFHNKMFDCPLIQVLWLRYKGNMSHWKSYIFDNKSK